MILINSDTNLLVAGVPVPLGQMELPFHGTVNFSGTVLTTNLSVGAGDTVIAHAGGVVLYVGVSPLEMFAGGVWLVVCVFGIMALGRRMARRLVGSSGASTM